MVVFFVAVLILIVFVVVVFVVVVFVAAVFAMVAFVGAPILNLMSMVFNQKSPHACNPAMTAAFFKSFQKGCKASRI